MRLIRMFTVLGVAAASLRCTGASPGPADGSPVVGAWGGRHAALTLTEARTGFCAGGRREADDDGAGV